MKEAVAWCGKGGRGNELASLISHDAICEEWLETKRRRRFYFQDR